MKMLTRNIAALVVMAFAATAFTPIAEELAEYTIDVQKSEITWKGKKVTGEHTGTIELQQGNLLVEDGKLLGGSFTIDMRTISNTDLAGEDKGKLEGHLKSDDFFGVESHPTATLEITDVKQESDNTYQVTGDLTIKGKTNEIQFPATVSTESGQVTAEASITVDRSEYDVRYGSDSFFDNLGDKVIYDDFQLEVSLVAENAVGK